MKTNEIIAGLRNCVTTQFTGCKDCPAYCRSSNCLNRLHTAAADTLETQQARIAELEAELKDERHRHDRYVDFELAEADELARVKAERRWIPVTEWLPEPDTQVLAIVSGRWENITFDRAYELVSWSAYEGWIIEAWPELEDPEVTHWMPLPEPPKEGK